MPHPQLVHHNKKMDTPTPPNQPTTPDANAPVAPPPVDPGAVATPASVAPAPGGSQPAAASQVASSQTPSSGGSKKLWIIIAAFIVVAVLVALGLMMFMSTQQPQNGTSDASNQIQETLNSVSTDLEGVVVDDVSADFKAVDDDLLSL
jgi:hypothetical protein